MAKTLTFFPWHALGAIRLSSKFCLLNHNSDTIQKNNPTVRWYWSRHPHSYSVRTKWFGHRAVPAKVLFSFIDTNTSPIRYVAPVIKIPPLFFKASICAQYQSSSRQSTTIASDSSSLTIFPNGLFAQLWEHFRLQRRKLALVYLASQDIPFIIKKNRRDYRWYASALS